MAIDIAALNATQKKDAFGPNTGSIMLAQGNISTPVSEVVLACPAGYYAFRLLIGDVMIYYPIGDYPALGADDNLCLQVSKDNQATWEDDPLYYTNLTQSSGGVVNGGGGPDTMTYLTQGGGSFDGFPMAAEVLIYPGSPAIYPYFKSDAMYAHETDPGVPGVYWVNMSSFFAGSKGRITDIKVGPYFGDGAGMTANYTLWGIPDVD